MSETRILPNPMRRLRRTPIQPRIELIPLIDVMTFLITYFIYATATLMRVDLVPMELQQFTSGKAATGAPAASKARASSSFPGGNVGPSRGGAAATRRIPPPSGRGKALSRA